MVSFDEVPHSVPISNNVQRRGFYDTVNDLASGDKMRCRIFVGSYSYKYTEKTNEAPRQVHYSDVIMNAIASLINDISIVYSTFCSGADQPENIKAH